MKNNLRLLTAFLKLFPPEKFFDLSVKEWKVTAMAKYDSDLVKQLLYKRFKGEVEDTGFTVFTRNSIRVVLT